MACSDLVFACFPMTQSIKASKRFDIHNSCFLVAAPRHKLQTTFRQTAPRSVMPDADVSSPSTHPPPGNCRRPPAPKECQRQVEPPELLMTACSRHCKNGHCTPTGKCCCSPGWEGPLCRVGEWLLFERKVTVPEQERIGGVTHSLFLNFCSVYLLKLLLNTKKSKVKSCIWLCQITCYYTQIYSHKNYVN